MNQIKFNFLFISLDNEKWLKIIDNIQLPIEEKVWGKQVFYL